MFFLGCSPRVCRMTTSHTARNVGVETPIPDELMAGRGQAIPDVDDELGGPRIVELAGDRRP